MLQNNKSEHNVWIYICMNNICIKTMYTYIFISGYYSDWKETQTSAKSELLMKIKH